MKILALQFKYFGDAVLLTPALRALRAHFPQDEIHLLVPAEIAPLFVNLPWLNRVWAMPRRRGRARLRETWPLIRALRREHFDRSVDFATNDRGAIVGLFAGARRRLGWEAGGGFWGRRFCYHDRVPPPAGDQPEAARLAALLAGWKIPPPDTMELEIRADPALAGPAGNIMPQTGAVLCHVASSQPKKEWPLTHWAEFHRLARAAGRPLVFTTAPGEREAARMAELKRLAPDAPILPEIPELPLFLAVLSRADVFISGDTGPLHFAAGLGVATIGLFGPTSALLWGPAGHRRRNVQCHHCDCSPSSPVCEAVRHCMAEIQPQEVLQTLQTLPARTP